jgi:acyl-CoA synthetase (AMP-forming)/AMP-acid ligase II
LRTGDQAVQDEAGHLRILDRRANLIVTGGENVWPAEVQAVLERHPAVAEACVVGIPHEQWGQAVVAALVPRPGQTATTEEIAAHCRSHLAPYKVPKHIAWWPHLPRTGPGKVDASRVRGLWVEAGSPLAPEEEQ